MKTVLIGFTINVGSFKGEDGQPIEYSNRELTFITDSGEDQKNIGFKPYNEKFKLADLARILKVQPNDDIVNDALKVMVNKAVWVQFAPVANTLKVVNFGLEQK